MFVIIQQDLEAAPTIVASIFIICGQKAKVLIDPGSTNSFFSPTFVESLPLIAGALDRSLSITTPVVDEVVVDTIYRGCVVTISQRELLVDLVLMAIRDFDVILMIDWLAIYQASVNCFEKRVIFKLLGVLKFSVKCSGILAPPYLISAMQIDKLMR